jgi:branched-chain amino acid transport system permease protein
VVLMGGVYNLCGAVIAALLLELLPGWLQSLGVSYSWLTILFGIGILATLTTAPTGMADQWRDLGKLIMQSARGPARSSPASTTTSPTSSAPGGEAP